MTALLAPVAIISFFLSLTSLPGHIRTRNLPGVMINFWLSTLAFIDAVNTIAWSKDVDLKLLVWCDIATKMHMGFSFGVPAASMCMVRQLESIASTRAASMTRTQLKRRLITEILICIGIPILFMALHYIAQGHRFDIFEDIGCLPAIYSSIPTIFIIWVPPLVMAIISLSYGSLIIYHFFRHRLTFATCLHASPYSISVSRYIRLLALSFMVIPWELAMDIYLLRHNISLLRPYVSWAYVHENFSHVGRVPWFLVPDSIHQAFMVAWWITPTSCLFSFLFFGTGSEAMKDYRRIFNWSKRFILRQKVVSQEDNSLCLPTIHAADMLRSSKFDSEISNSEIWSTAKYKPSDGHLSIHVALPSSMPTPPRRALLLGGPSNERLPHTRAPSANGISRCAEVHITIERTMS